jgi:hypothetical protein
MAKLSELERQEREAAYRERLRARARQADKDLGLTVSGSRINFIKDGKVVYSSQGDGEE